MYDLRIQFLSKLKQTFMHQIRFFLFGHSWVALWQYRTKICSLSNNLHYTSHFSIQLNPQLGILMRERESARTNLMCMFGPGAICHKYLCMETQLQFDRQGNIYAMLVFDHIDSISTNPRRSLVYSILKKYKLQK